MMHNGAIFKEGTPGGDRERPRGAGALSGGGTGMAERGARSGTCRARGARAQRLLRRVARVAGRDLRLERGVLSVVGRNGMGKTTLCKAIMGLVPAASGSISVLGQPLAGPRPAEIARMGIGYVPQGRRLWRSLTVDEHLKMVERKGGAWSIERIYATFPRLARAQVQRRRPAFGWRAADAGHLARAAGQPAPSGDGRTDRGAGPRHRRAGRGDASPPRRGRRHGRARDRAEHRRRLRRGRPVAIMVNGRINRIVPAARTGGRPRPAAAPSRRRPPCP